MIKDSIKTVLKNPKLILGFLIPVVLLMLCYIPAIINAPSNSTLLYSNSDALFATFASTLLVMLFAIFTQFIYFPVLYNYVYEFAANGRVEKGWIKRGLKKNWWKIFVTFIISMTPFYIVYFIAFMILFMLLFSGGGSIAAYIVLGTIFLAITTACYSYYYIATVTVVAEENFGKGLKNAFRIGIKNFLKVSLINFMLFAVGALIGYFIVEYDSPYYVFGMNAGEAILIFVIVLAVLALIGITSAFIFIYINKIYMKRRPVLDEKDALKLQSQAEQNVVE